MNGSNVLVIMSDEHAFEALGCYGHPLVRTPHIDALAERGVRFTNAYTPSPMCVPTRAAIATGRYPHETGYWDSAHPYDGRVPSWGHRLIANGRTCVSVGKLHFRSSDDDNGFAPELLPMHVVGGIGWMPGLLRDPLPDYTEQAAELARDTGVGDSAYTEYDRRICARACTWLRQEAAGQAEPWTLFVSFVAPHYPLTAPEEFFALYPADAVDPPRDPDGAGRHPVLDALRAFYCYGDFFSEDKARIARAAYYGLVSFLDHNVGQVLDALEHSGLAGDTLVVYTSDHGELLGNHGLWTKQTMHEESAGVPLILAGPGVAAGNVRDDPVSLIDLYPTIVEAAGVGATPGDPEHGVSLMTAGEARSVLSEFHDGGSTTGFFMIRWAKWKYVHYVGAPPQLFDLSADPHELADLAARPDAADILAEGERRLRAMLDPEDVNARAFAAQADRIAAFGGRDALERLGAFKHTPAPGTEPDG
ncbi:MAG: sulfatase-like hydrolase/transferase [Hyphomicrobiales bacterium]